MRLDYLALLLVATLFAAPSYAGEIRPYTDPLPLGNYVDDVDDLLARAYSYDGWRDNGRTDDGARLAFISYKGFDITVRIDVEDDNLSMGLVSVFETGCGDNCTHLGEKDVIQWIVNLRRTIAFVFTQDVRDSMQDQLGR
jgi:hypothetical protein